MKKILVERLKELNLTIATAESCTGGLLAAAITSVSGASEVISESIVTYSNCAKTKYLNVSKNLLLEFTEYSGECAIEMAKGIKDQAKTDIGISTTGIAGPSGGNDLNPVGTVYIGVSYKNTSFVKMHFEGTRESIREQAVNKAIDLVLKQL